MEFRVLGPLEVRVDGRDVDLGGIRQRRVLAALLCSPNRTVSVSRLVEAVWDDDPPATARRQIQNRVASLRAVLTRHGGFIDTTDAAYRLRVGPGELDAQLFDELASQGQAAADPGLLRRALRLWRGPALSGLGSALLDRESAGLEERRLGVLEECLELELAAGEHAQVVAELSTLVAEHPLREGFVGQLMLALYRCGRQADALAAYRAMAVRLAEELGVDPGPEVRRRYEAMLRGEIVLTTPVPSGTEPSGPPSAPAAPLSVPAQLPADVAGFTGRVAALARLDRLLSDGQTEPAVVISTISGTAGVGKTAIAVHWAHRVRDKFSDGQLYVNLRGYDTQSPLRPFDALGGFLRALGVPGERVPADADEAAALYRTLLADRRVFVLLDNAASAEQVRPLLPGASASIVLVTSRDALGGLVARDGARRLVLDVLDPDEAGVLLARVLGADRVAAEPQATAELARLCGYLPLALRIAAANLTDEDSIAGYVAALARGDRLGALQVDGDGQAAVRVAFERSYRSLPASAQRMFRRLSLAPGPDAGVPTAAALAGTSLPEAQSLLDRLAAAHLVDQRRTGRYSHHDLLRVYAAELVDPEERRAATGRMLDHLLHTAHRAALLLYPHRDVAPLPPADSDLPLPDLPDAPTALAWFTTEYAGLVNAVRMADSGGYDAYAWQLAWTTTDYSYRQGHWHEMVETQRIGLAAAQRAADQAGQARLQRGVASAYIRLGGHDEARTHLGYALDLYGAIGDQAGQARTHLDLGSMSGKRGRLADAIEHSERALELSRMAGYDTGQARALSAIGWFRALDGDYPGALTRSEEAAELQRRLGDQYGEANTQDSLGYIWQQLGDLDKAVHHYRLSIETHREIGSRAGQAVAAGRLGDAHAAAGDLDTARDLWRDALDVLDELGHRGADDLRAKLG